MKLLLKLFIIILFTSCSNTDKESNNELVKENLLQSETDLGNEIPDRPMKDQFVIAGDSVTIPEFEIEIKLSENAEKKLKSEKESVIVQAYFSGRPKDTTLTEYIKQGEINIGASKIELFDKRIARFKNVKISKDEFELLSDKNFEVLINVFSGRRTSPDNLLDMELLQDGIDSIKAKRHVLKGKLIYGD